MRVITGMAKGMKLTAAPGQEIRPTADRVKESIFSAVQFDVEGRRVLDLFAGSGQMGVEALSRGAAGCVFVDNSDAAVNTIYKNLEHTGLSNAAKVVKADYKAFLQRADKRSFDLVFVDPPYSGGYAEKVIKAVQAFDILAPYAIIVLETARDERLKDDYGGIQKGREYVYGSTKITCLHNSGNAPERE